VKCRHRVFISTLSCEFLHLFNSVYHERFAAKKKMGEYGHCKQSEWSLRETES